MNAHRMWTLAGRTLCSLLGGLLLLFQGGWQQAAEPPPRPAAGSAPTARQTIPHETFQLGNGLRVILQEDHRAPFVTVCVVYHVGAFHESPGLSGLAHFFEHLMFEGSGGTLPANAFQMLGDMGTVSRNGTTHWHETVYFETVPAVNLTPALWLEGDRMESLAISRGIQTVRDIVKNERRQSLETVPYGAAFEAMAQARFPAPHPYSHEVIGSMADLDRATADKMREFYQAWYGPNNATLVLVGDFDSAEARRLVQKTFASIRRRGTPLMPSPSAPTLAQETRLRVTDPLATTPALFLEWTSPVLLSADDAVADVVSEILRERLKRRLVYVTNLATGVGVEQDSRAVLSTFDVRLLLRSSTQFGKTLALTDAVLAELRQDTASEEEVARARQKLITHLYWRLEDPVSRAQMMVSYLRYQGTPDWFRQDLARYERVMPADVGRFVRDVLRPEARVVAEIETRSQEVRR